MTVLPKLKHLAGIVRSLPKPVLISSIVVLVIGLTVAVWSLAPDPPKLFDDSGTVIYTTDKPEENKLGVNDYDWQGKDDEPRYINLPTIGAAGYIQKVGVDQNKQVSAPTNISLAGWFVEGARPGERGLSIIDGHVDGARSDGIFKDLAKLQKDHIFTVELGNDKLLQYRVIAIQTVDTKDAATILFSQNPATRSQLNLITCGGNFDTDSRLYDKRVIVSSELLADS